MSDVVIANQTARRYLLGRQGLWPGRRWSGKAGVAAALLQVEAVQVDTISAVARNHDLVLWSRVANYDPADLDAALYQDRAFFDYGGILMIYPAGELPYWRAIMRRHAAQRARYAPDTAVLEQVRAELRTRGPLASRDFASERGGSRGWRSGKQSGLALYHLWRTGELMTHSRRGFDRVYDFHDKIAGSSPEEASLEEAERFFAGKAIRDLGLATASEWARRVAVFWHRRPAPREARALLDGLTVTGELARVTVEGRKEPCYLFAVDLPVLTQLATGQIPPAWQSLAATSQDAANFIAPLDNAIWDRARTRALFDFDYVWEVYKPAHLRRWGYYTMPVLWGDRLVGRLNPKLDRRAGVLTVDGVWLEDAGLAANDEFITALAHGLTDFARFHAAARLDLSVVEPRAWRARLQTAVAER